jgi:AcrR family transcriptional regulator
MRVRADATAATRARILDAVIALGYDDLDLDPTLERVAGRAGVSAQTVLRHFGSREALLDAALETAQRQVVEERVPTEGGPDAALTALLAHYELRGRFSLEMLARERTDQRARAVTTPGKRLHRDWVESAFAERIAGRDATDHETLVDLLVVATDVFTWKLLHLDRGLPAAVVLDRVRTLTDAILARP